MGHLPLAYTPGEPAGIGPELILQIIAKGDVPPLVAICDKRLLEARAKQLDLGLSIELWDGNLAPSEFKKGIVYCQHTDMPAPSIAGELNVNNAHYVVDCLDQAIDGCFQNRFSGIVTGPLHKGIINEAGTPFSGHTEHLQMRCKVDKVVMMLASPRMRVALATTHLPLKDVAANITQSSLQQIISILVDDLQNKFGIKRPRVIIAGLNPHAGEDGHMGREEIDVIIPAINSLELNADFIGPLPADTLFNKKQLETADAVLAMYHDQGLPVLKFDGFGESVNITLGLPIIRTSVDHGTALDLAGKGIADTGSLKTAISIASEMVHAHRK